MKARKAPILLGIAALIGLGAAAVTAGAATDFGKQVEQNLDSKSGQLFGINKPLDASSQASISAGTANADLTKLVTLADPLKARVVTSSAAPNIDMMALWPNDQNPEWIIACNEQGTAAPGLQRIRISDGQTETILTGTSDCDPAHVTPWGTIVFGEEAGGGANGGQLYELIDPINTTGVTLDRSTNIFSGGTGASNFAVRTALGRTSYEGVAVLPNGVVYYGDENRPSNGTPGGAYFKFVPSTLREPGAGPISALSDSPLASGSVWGLRLGLRSGGTDYGQATQTGFGKWIPLVGPDLRAAAAANKLTGYYRPEDLNVDPARLAAGNVRLCGNNTGNEVDDRNYGETICITDGTLAEAGANSATPEVQFLVVGDPQLAMMDNIAYQPGTGNWVLHEDGDQLQGNNDLWDCLDDGQDDNLLSDGCVRIGTLNDLNAEWTGGLFDATGKRFFVSVQHNVSGHGVVLEITGWK